MKIMGVCADFLYWRISFAVSRPSMSGMLTSSRITANSRCSTSRSASEPERTMTRFCPSSSRMLLKTSSFSGRSSTTRMLAFSSLTKSGTDHVFGECSGNQGRRKTWSVPAFPSGSSPVQPAAQHGEQMQAVHRLRQVVPGARGDALLAVALHRLRGHRDDRQVGAAVELADLADGGDAVHLRHHDVHQDDVDVGIVLHDVDRL